MCAVCFTSLQFLPAAGIAGRAIYVARRGVRVQSNGVTDVEPVAVEDGAPTETVPTSASDDLVTAGPSAPLR